MQDIARRIKVWKIAILKRMLFNFNLITFVNIFLIVIIAALHIIHYTCNIILFWCRPITWFRFQWTKTYCFYPSDLLDLHLRRIDDAWYRLKFFKLDYGGLMDYVWFHSVLPYYYTPIGSLPKIAKSTDTSLSRRTVNFFISYLCSSFLYGNNHFKFIL